MSEVVAAGAAMVRSHRPQARVNCWHSSSIIKSRPFPNSCARLHGGRPFSLAYHQNCHMLLLPGYCLSLAATIPI